MHPRFASPSASGYDGRSAASMPPVAPCMRASRPRKSRKASKCGTSRRRSRRRRSTRAKRSRARSACSKPRSRRRPRKCFKINCQRICTRDKVTRNPFLNFLRVYRATHPGIPAVEVAVKGARKWNHMTRREKKPYLRQAHKAPRTRRKSRRKSCAAAPTPSETDCSCSN